MLLDTNTEVQLTAGVDYSAPSGPAFVRIVNTRLTGMGRPSGGGRQSPDRWMVWIAEESELASSFTIRRYGTNGDNRVAWQLIEYRGDAGGDNEIAVRAVGSLSFGAASLTVTSAPIAGLDDDADIVVLVTGQAADSSMRERVNAGMATAGWNALQDEAEFERGASGVEATVSYAVVEFTGSNWSIQRHAHTYSLAGAIEDEVITDLGAPDRAFLHVQQRSQGTDLDDQGAEVWLSSTSTISFVIESTVSTPSDITSVAWVVQNADTTSTQMRAEHYSGERLPIDATAEEDVWTDAITAVSSLDGSAIIGETGRSAGTNTDFPIGSILLSLSDVDEVTLVQSDAGQEQNYRFSIVEWPNSAADAEVPVFSGWALGALALTLVGVSGAVLVRTRHPD